MGAFYTTKIRKYKSTPDKEPSLQPQEGHDARHSRPSPPWIYYFLISFFLLTLSSSFQSSNKNSNSTNNCKSESKSNASTFQHLTNTQTTQNIKHYNAVRTAHLSTARLNNIIHLSALSWSLSFKGSVLLGSHRLPYLSRPYYCQRNNSYSPRDL